MLVYFKMPQDLKNNYTGINQYYRMDNTMNQNPPFGIATFYQLGPQPYCLAPRTCHGFHQNVRDQYETYLNSIFIDYKLPAKPNKFGYYKHAPN